MKRVGALLLAAIACACLSWAVYQVAAPADHELSRFMPADAMLYLEARDFAGLIADFNASSEKRDWLRSTSYEVFSRSRLFLRLKAASDQFAVAGGISPDMKFLSQVAGGRSAIAIYDIGKMQFLYITHLSAANSMQTALWQTRSKFEPRSAGAASFYLRRDPESQREVAFAIFGDYLLLSTREDLMAGALNLLSNQRSRTIEDEAWFKQATNAAQPAGDLRLVLNLEKIVPDGYFRTYWVQQNITDLSQYSAAVSDLFRSSDQYREERVLIRKEEPESLASSEALSATADVVRLVPEKAGWFKAVAGPSSEQCFDLLTSNILAPHLVAATPGHSAPQVQLTSGEAGGSTDLETRIDQAIVSTPTVQQKSALETLLQKTPILAALQVQSTTRDSAGVFVRIHTAIVLSAASAWKSEDVRSTVADFVRPTLSASGLGVSWQAKANHQELDGLWPIAFATKDKYLVISDDPALLERVISNFVRQTPQQPAQLIAAFNHEAERANFRRMAELVDRPSANVASADDPEPQPQFFSGTIASFSEALAPVSRESIVVRGDNEKVRETVTYQWSH